MTHAEFVAAYATGSIRVQVDRERAAKLVSGRLMLPLVMLPFLGLAVALALVGYAFTGIGLFVLVIALRYFVRASSRGFVLSRALRDPAFYEEALARGALSFE